MLILRAGMLTRTWTGADETLLDIRVRTGTINSSMRPILLCPALASVQMLRLGMTRGLLLDRCSPEPPSQCRFAFAERHRGHARMNARQPRTACITRRRQNKPTNTKEPKQRSTQQRTTARHSADLKKPNQIPSQQTHLENRILLRTARL